MNGADEEGTYYYCGCWKAGRQDKHPPQCPTHGMDWKLKYIRDPQTGSFSSIEFIKGVKDETRNPNPV